MTIPNQVGKVIVHGNGSATVFSFDPMIIPSSEGLEVTLRDEFGDETILTEGVGARNYIVSVAEYPGTGFITYPADAVNGVKLKEGERLSLRRSLPYVQEVDLENRGGYYPDVQEGALDYLTMLCIFLQEQVDRCVKAPVTDTASGMILPTSRERAGGTLGFDADGNFIVGGALETVYQGASATDPTTRVTGNALEVGDIYFNTILRGVKIYDGSVWVTISANLDSKVNVFGDTMTGALIIQDNLTAEDGTFSGDVSVGGDEDIAGNVSIEGSLDVTGATTVDDLSVTGDMSVTGAAAFSEAPTVATVPLPFTKAYESPSPTALTSTLSSISVSEAHGLGEKPKLYFSYLRCLTEDGDYSVGDEVLFTMQDSNGSSSPVVGTATSADITNVAFAYRNTAENILRIPYKNGSALLNITGPRWGVVLRAYA